MEVPSSSVVAANTEEGIPGFDRSNEDDLIKASLLEEVIDTKHKTPVLVLHELLNKRGRTAIYELVEAEGAIHEMSFKYRVSFGSEDVVGAAGTSKKEAKHNAARDLLKILCPKIDFEAPKIDEDNEEIDRNPVGRLQNLCIHRSWAPPIYELENELGQAHNKSYVMVCKVGQFQDKDEGSSKKIAKRKVAFKMFKRLTAMNEESLRKIDDFLIKSQVKAEPEQESSMMRSEPSPRMEMQGNKCIPAVGASSSNGRPNPMEFLDSPHQVVDYYGQRIADYLKHFPMDEAKFIFQRIETDLILTLKRRQHNIQFPNRYNNKRIRNNHY